MGQLSSSPKKMLISKIDQDNINISTHPQNDNLKYYTWRTTEYNSHEYPQSWSHTRTRYNELSSTKSKISTV